MILCPDCKGKGIFFDFGYGNNRYKQMAFRCFRCNESGRVPDEMLKWIERGKQIRESRLRRDVSLRKEAENLRLLASAYSDIEQGMVDNSKWQP